MKKFKKFKGYCKSKGEAHSRADYLLKILRQHFKRGKFKKSVWQNFGWHYHVTCGTIQIMHSPHSNEYWCLVDDKKGIARGGSMLFKGDFYDANPVKVIQKAMKTMKIATQGIVDAYEDNVKQFAVK